MADSTKPHATEVMPPVSEQHKLKNSYTFHVVRRKGAKAKNPPTGTGSWADNIEEIGSFGTVEQFWAFYNHLIRPTDLSTHDYHLFKQGIVPMWEDEKNRNGGKFIVRSKKQRKIADRYWEDMILATIGEQFEDSDEICGIVMSCKVSDDVLSIWNRTSTNPELIERMKEQIRLVLNLPAGFVIDYKAHNQSITEAQQHQHLQQQQQLQQQQTAATTGNEGVPAGGNP